MPDESVLTVSCQDIPRTERYLIAANRWVAAADTPVLLVQPDADSREIGPAVLLPDGRVFAIGATGHTAYYTRGSTASNRGNWVVGPLVPNDPSPVDGRGTPMIAKDAPACLLPSGRVLAAVSPYGSGTNYPGPTYLCEFGGSNDATAELVLLRSARTLRSNAE